MKLRTYTGELIPVLGVATVIVNHNKLELSVTAGASPSLIGHELHELKLDWSTIHSV